MPTKFFCPFLKAFQSRMKFLAALVLIAGLLLPAPLIASASPEQAATCTQYYRVQRGDSLFKIGLKFGVSWRTLAEINSLSNPRLIFAGQLLCVSTGTVPTPVPSGKIPTFTITGVVKDQSVTIQTANFPANDTFNVLMGAFGTRGINGIKVDTINSGKGGTFSATFKVPAALAGSARIAIRLQSPTSGFFSYNWFWNNTTGTGTGGGGTTPGPVYTGFPTFSIASVVRNNTVTISGFNYPPNDTFNVYMGAFGTRGINGIKVGSFNTGTGGSLSLTFSIPAALQGSTRIAIRTQSPTSGFFAYNWFWNNTAN